MKGSLTPSQRMADQSTRVSAYSAPRTAQGIADEWLDTLVGKARSGSEPIKHYGRITSRAVRFVLAEGGPGADITFLFQDDIVDYAVLDYSEGTARAQRVLTGYDAELLFGALSGTGDDEEG